MIVTNLIGGLGNQMFQFAAGFALSLERRTSLALAVDLFEGYKWHNGFELARVFGIKTCIADADMLRRLIGWRAPARMRRMLARFPVFEPLCGRRFIAERLVTPKKLFSSPADAYLHGYWQSEQFFVKHKDAIKAAFTFAPPQDGRNAALAARIAMRPSASIHIRRGDYLVGRNAALYNQCSPEYLLSSMNLLQKLAGTLRYFVFSDDVGWASAVLADKGHECEFVCHNQGRDSFNDMRLMSLCNHHIVANSSFSWWGAWLNPSEDKIVVAPRQWMVGVPSTGIVPGTWLQL